MQIIYLDQNKWIELARAAKHPEEYPELFGLLSKLGNAVEAGRALVPLTATNIYETHKIAQPRRRNELAAIQSFLSRGCVFRGRHKRLEVEFGLAFLPVYGNPPPTLGPYWFLSDIFFEAFAEYGDERTPTVCSERFVTSVRREPAFWLYHYLTEVPEQTRVAAVAAFSKGSEQLRKRIEERRAQHASESISMRRRIQSALLAIAEIDLILKFAADAGLPWKSVTDIGRSNLLRLVNEVPTYHIEREVVLRLESQTRPIEENDFRDMQTFCAVLRYADDVVAENMFSNLARQARLDKKYDTRVCTNLLSLTATLH